MFIIQLHSMKKSSHRTFIQFFQLMQWNSSSPKNVVVSTHKHIWSSCNLCGKLEKSVPNAEKNDLKIFFLFDDQRLENLFYNSHVIIYFQDLPNSDPRVADCSYAAPKQDPFTMQW